MREPIVVLVVVVVVIVVGTVAARRLGYRVGKDVIVRCRHGHVFTTVWVSGVSLKAIRLGSVRLQRCPVGEDWTFVRRIRDADLTDDDRRSAAEHRDTPIP